LQLQGWQKLQLQPSTVDMRIANLYGFIEQQLAGEHDWYVQAMLRDKLNAINTILKKLPYSLTDVIEDFEREIL
jgi:hypothetical protein